MTLIRRRTSIPVPTVYAYEVDTRNPTSAAFILMQVVSGNVATDSDGGYEVHQGQIPLHRRPPFYLAAAKIQVQMTSDPIGRLEIQNPYVYPGIPQSACLISC
ncbi:hypothetical protein HRG_004719 [Hirsutella rhossiliensis]|uniref:Uncharacterized protein n=1 Tax=Hirsutella rhossiliensis TaxID=111463 RepID=A0A9P8SIV8_9HYPO|nr:uncharacterized protein HRG_04719 [Hirsutella rhossiliensis]KAH0964291.1 hypothetical protein HRG_04719 [Hirsutella rhossiliensis]